MFLLLKIKTMLKNIIFYLKIIDLLLKKSVSEIFLFSNFENHFTNQFFERE